MQKEKETLAFNLVSWHFRWVMRRGIVSQLERGQRRLLAEKVRTKPRKWKCESWLLRSGTRLTSRVCEVKWGKMLWL